MESPSPHQHGRVQLHASVLAALGSGEKEEGRCTASTPSGGDRYNRGGANRGGCRSTCPWPRASGRAAAHWPANTPNRRRRRRRRTISSGEPPNFAQTTTRRHKCLKSSHVAPSIWRGGALCNGLMKGELDCGPTLLDGTVRLLFADCSLQFSIKTNAWYVRRQQGGGGRTGKY